MVSSYLLVTILVIITYYFVREHDQFNATSSAIQQVWSGTCRLSCRQSNYSRCSGLSGLPRPVANVHDSDVPNSRCVCLSCPCKLIKDVLNKCSPATRVCANTTGVLGGYLYNAIKTIVDMYNYMNRVFECSAACQLQLDITQTQAETTQQTENAEHVDDSSPPTEFEVKERREFKRHELHASSKGSRVSRPGEAVSSSSAKLSRRGSNSLYNSAKSNNSIRPSGKGSTTTVSRSITSIKQTRKTSADDITETADAERNMALRTAVSSESCPTCVQKGKVCIGGCPNVKKRDSSS